ncbi:MAG: sigma-70 family RNA polymerase sigma factor [Nannocystaceae bacterium]|nr:sigma-70 family RNA polymerase sigma factor [Nannocystaceae bacterium]
MNDESPVQVAAPPFREVVRVHQARVHRYCLMLTRDPAQAEDLLQETFVDAMRGYESYRGDAAVLTWLLTIARNRCQRMNRLRAGAPPQTEELMVLGLEAGWGSAAALEEDLDAAVSRAAMSQALEALSPADCEVITLRDLEELTTREAAEVLELSEAAVRVRLHRARLRFVAEIRRQGGLDA